MWDDLSNFLDKISPLLYIIIPTIVGISFNLKLKIQDKKQDIIKKNKDKALEVYNAWEHEESRKIISKIKDLCNFYKDKGHMDLVHYLQLENGTVATSKLCNMFLTCLAEDGRFGTIPKILTKLQRVPYSRVSDWIEDILKTHEHGEDYFIIHDMDNTDYALLDLFKENNIHSSIAVPIYDPNNLLIGFCVFYYTNSNLNNQTDESAATLIRYFQSSIESIFLSYHLDRKSKKRELGLIGDDD